jgi:hypothetical protein
VFVRQRRSAKTREIRLASKKPDKLKVPVGMNISENSRFGATQII